MRLLRATLVFFAVIGGLLARPAAAELRLLMFEQPGCAYCAQWDRTIAPIYSKTTEGQLAPLERVQLRGALRDGTELSSKPVYTPTFVLLDDGREVGRIEGYPGEDFFWGLLSHMIMDLPEDRRRMPNG